MKTKVPEPSREHEHAEKAVDLLDSGLLWLINASVFHPRGFALALADDGCLLLLGDGSEPWSFAQNSTTDAKFESVNALFRSYGAGQ